MKVIWSPQAVQDRLTIWAYLLEVNPQAAIDMDERFSKAASLLVTQPLIGHFGKVEGTRELTPHESYRLVYEIQGEHVVILALVHTARQWPPAKD